MNIEIRNIITKVVSEFWKPYEELEVKIQKLLIKKNIHVNSVFVAGDITNMYIFRKKISFMCLMKILMSKMLSY